MFGNVTSELLTCKQNKLLLEVSELKCKYAPHNAILDFEILESCKMSMCWHSEFKK